MSDKIEVYWDDDRFQYISDLEELECAIEDRKRIRRALILLGGYLFLTLGMTVLFGLNWLGAL